MTEVRRIRGAVERAILGAFMSGALLLAERLLTAEHERTRAKRQARQRSGAGGGQASGSRRTRISVGRRS